MLTFEQYINEQYINEQRIDELSSDLLKRAAIAAKNRNAGKVDARTRRFEKAAIDALKREIAQSEIDTTDMSASTNTQKYELYKQEGNFWRIRALKDIKLSNGNIIKAGTLGGLVDSEDNLSQDGTCWVFGDAKVYNNAKVSDNAYVYGNARVYSSAHVYGNAKVYDDARVYWFAEVYDNAAVYGKAIVFDDAKVCGKAQVYGNAKVHNSACVQGEAKVDYDVDEDQI